MKQIEINPANKPYYTGDFIKGFECGTKTQFDADKEATNNAIIIPRGATNGDIVEKIFGKDVYCTLIRMMYSSCCEKLKDWWNTPYKRSEGE